MFRDQKHHILAICLDCGDTLVDEGAEVKDEYEVTQHASLIPGAAELVQTLKRLGYPLALVADGPAGTFHNVLTQHNLYHYFDAFAISGEVGVAKPDARMFHHALDQLAIAPAAYGRVLMVGNNLERDIKGANALGICSVWLDWAPRRAKIPADATEVPCYTIKMPLDLLPLLATLEATWPAPAEELTSRLLNQPSLSSISG
ncbi:MAG: HAD-IA family hydrolase [Caldilineaceae bacterium]